MIERRRRPCKREHAIAQTAALHPSHPTLALAARNALRLNESACVRAEGFLGEGELATVRFKVVGSGDPAFRLASVDARSSANRKITVGTATRVAPVVPRVTSFAGAVPNPARNRAAMVFGLSKQGTVDLSIFSVDGRMVRSLVHESRAAGTYRLAWDGRDQAGRAVSSGIYYARLVTEQGRFTRALTFIR